MIPVAGAVFDGINATWYLAEGDYTNAALSGMTLIPVVGEFAGAGKTGVEGGMCADDIVDAVKAVDNTRDVVKAVENGGTYFIALFRAFYCLSIVEKILLILLYTKIPESSRPVPNVLSCKER